MTDHRQKRVLGTQRQSQQHNSERADSLELLRAEQTGDERDRDPASAFDDSMLAKRARPPERWSRRALARVMRAITSLGPGAGARRRLARRVAVPVSGARRIAIISRKGGIGKTTTTLMLGHTFASHREDRVVALDGNPDAGSLTYRIPRETTNNMLDLLTARGDLTRYSDMRAFTNRTNTRLEVLAAVEDPRISEALGERDYRRVCELLAYHYCLTCMDTGTGMLESAERGIFDLADQAVLVLGTSVDSARTAASTLDWLEENGHEDLVDDAVCVINSVTGKAAVGMDRIDRHFRARCREVVRIPWDPHLSVGAEAELGQLRPSTRAAYLELAAAVSDGF